jgi:hypothetical protein
LGERRSFSVRVVDRSSTRIGTPFRSWTSVIIQRPFDHGH